MTAIGVVLSPLAYLLAVMAVGGVLLLALVLLTVLEFAVGAVAPASWSALPTDAQKEAATWLGVLTAAGIFYAAGWTFFAVLRHTAG